VSKKVVDSCDHMNKVNQNVNEIQKDVKNVKKSDLIGYTYVFV